MEIKALTFDIFGTVTDWRNSIQREGQILAAQKDVIDVDWFEFADRWRGQYTPFMDKVRQGELPWTNIDGLHRLILDGLLEDYQIGHITEEEKQHFNFAWHRLVLWPDVINGLNRLSTDFLLATLSNGNTELLSDIAENSGLSWDFILSAEDSKHYKPDQEVYLSAIESIGLEPKYIMMVAAHAFDLKAAQKVGMKTAYVYRELEFGPCFENENINESDFDLVAKDFEDLAGQLGC